jgi:hypothetical protein
MEDGECETPSILNPDNRWKASGQFKAPAALSPGSWHPLGWPAGIQSRIGRFREEKDLLTFSGIEP